MQTRVRQLLWLLLVVVTLVLLPVVVVGAAVLLGGCWLEWVVLVEVGRTPSFCFGGEGGVLEESFLGCCRRTIFDSFVVWKTDCWWYSGPGVRTA